MKLYPPEMNDLKRQIVETLSAKISDHSKIPDLDYCVEGLLMMFEIKRRPLPLQLNRPCYTCKGEGHVLKDYEQHHWITCPECQGKRCFSIK